MKVKYALQSIGGDHRESGIYNSNSWRREAENHFYSALELRDLSGLAKEKASRAKAKSQRLDRDVLEILVKRRALAKSSLLLLGYALELSLKSGVVSLFRDMPRKYLKESLKNRFSHRLSLAARFIELPLCSKEEAFLDQMSDLIVADARYPITPTGAGSFRKEFNRLDGTIVDDEFFDMGVAVFKKIKNFSSRLGGVEDCVVTHAGFEIGTDGAMSCRLGGGISNRVLVSYSSEQKREGEDNALKLWRLIEDNVEVSLVLRMLVYEGVDKVKLFEL